MNDIYKKSPAIKNANRKFWEADYFLMLISLVESRRKGLIERSGMKIMASRPSGTTYDDPPAAADEIEYLFSAFLNASYSAIEHLKRDKALDGIAKKFQQSHSRFYKSGPDGEMRTKATHFSPLKSQFNGYLAKRVGEGESATIEPALGEDVEDAQGLLARYKFDGQKELTVFDMCSQHISELRALIRSCRRKITDKKP